MTVWMKKQCGTCVNKIKVGFEKSVSHVESSDSNSTKWCLSCKIHKSFSSSIDLYNFSTRGLIIALHPKKSTGKITKQSLLHLSRARKKITWSYFEATIARTATMSTCHVTETIIPIIIRSSSILDVTKMMVKGISRSLKQIS